MFKEKYALLPSSYTKTFLGGCVKTSIIYSIIPKKFKENNIIKKYIIKFVFASACIF